MTIREIKKVEVTQQLFFFEGHCRMQGAFGCCWQGPTCRAAAPQLPPDLHQIWTRSPGPDVGTSLYQRAPASPQATRGS